MLTRLQLRNFRCFDALELEPAPDVSLFVGANAQGKTSLLEAVCVLLRLQSPRTRSPGDLVRFDSPALAVEGEYDGAGLRLTHGNGKRRIWLDGDEQKSARDYLAAGLVVWMGNTDRELVRGPGEGRRRYLDFVAAQIHPPYRRALRNYENALRSRNALLKEPRPDWREIGAWSVPLIENGGILTDLRTDVVTKLLPFAAEAQRAVSQRDESLVLDYKPGASDDFARALEESRPREKQRRLTLVGPHRDDVSLTLNRLPAGQYGSEGQQRTIALALKLAQARLLRDLSGRNPILLLDDIFGELDPARRNALLQYLPPEAQKLITTTHLDWAEQESLPAGQIYEVHAGGLGDY